MLDLYIERLGDFIALERAAFMHHYYAFVYVRIMQALGAYGFRGFYERKPHFLQSVPYALKNLRWLLQHVELPIALPTLMHAFHSMVASEKLQGLASEAENLDDVEFSASPFTGACPRMKPDMAADSFSTPQPAQSRPRRAIQSSHRQRCAR